MRAVIGRVGVVENARVVRVAVVVGEPLVLVLGAIVGAVEIVEVI